MHGHSSATAIQHLTTILFDHNTDFADFSEAELLKFSKYLPVTNKGALLVDVLVANGLADSKKKARGFIAAGAITVNGVKATEDIALEQTAIIKKGKNKFLIVK